MIRAFRLLRSSISAWYYDLFILIAANLFWILLSILIIPLGPATAALFYVANEVSKGEPISFGLFWVGLKRYAGISFRLALALIVISLLIIVNMGFYLNMPSTVGQIVGIVWIYVLVFWGVFLNYPFALLMQMENPGVIKILRNSALLVLDNVALTFSMSILTVLLIGLSIFPLGLLPFAFGFFALLAIFQCKSVAQLIEKYEQKHPAPGGKT